MDMRYNLPIRKRVCSPAGPELFSFEVRGMEPQMWIRHRGDRWEPFHVCALDVVQKTACPNKHPQ